jgi:hypothetical protein
MISVPFQRRPASVIRDFYSRRQLLANAAIAAFVRRLVAVRRRSVLLIDGRAAEKAGRLHKLWHCAGTREAARCNMESTFPAIFFATIIGVIVFIAVGQVLLDPHD